ncbi:S41 family peptidase [Streptomyces puniciscabiei]|uniref:S41 family peptidase n=1 Tax=Streptomyces puniciscabiei TaxID=164348 RepID=UPI003EB913ED
MRCSSGNRPCWSTSAARCASPPATARGSGPRSVTRHRDHALLAADSSVGHRMLRRLNALPAACTRPAPADPRTAFDVFWQTFEENSPFFARKHIDWHAVRDRYRPLVHEDTTKDQLFGILSRMVRPLYDAHVTVTDGDRHFGQVRPGTQAPSPELDAGVRKFIAARDPVAVLTGGSTVSAGETFTQALMDRPGPTVRIGRPTQGVFSDVLERTLPDGLRFGLPNEEYLTRAGRTFDGTGLPPRLTEPVFTEEEFAENRDSAFDRAVNLLGGRG